MKDKNEERQRKSKLQVYGLLSCEAVLFCGCLPTSRKNLIHVLSTLKKGQQVSLKRMYPFFKKHKVTTKQPLQ
jgi:hypothetical protein